MQACLNSRLGVVLICVALSVGVSSAHAQTANPAQATRGQSPAHAQSADVAKVVPAAPPSEAAKAVDGARSQLDVVQATLRRENVDDATLQTLRAQIDPIHAALQGVIDQIAPQVDAVKARLAQLGPKPDDKAPPEAPAITADRDAQQTLFNEADDLLKRARLLSVQADQVSDAIISRRRASFLKDLFERTQGIFAPALWRTVVADLPREVSAIRQTATDFVSRAGSSLEGWRLPTFFGLLALLAGFAILAVRTGRRILRREPSVADPGPLRKVLGACWYAMVVAVVPIALMALLLVLADAFDLFSDRLMPLQRALAGAVTRIALMAAFARAVLAPGRPNWQLLAVPDAAAERLSHLLVSLAVLVSAIHVVDVLHEIIVSSVSTTVVARGSGALLASLIIAVTLYGLPAEAETETECLGPRVDERRDWLGLIRLAGWLLSLAILVAVAVGYVAFGAFLADQLIWVCTIGLGAYLLLQLSVDAVDAQFRPGALAGRLLSTSVGLRRERLGQIGILLSGILRVAIFIVAALLIVAPWGIQSDDLSGTLRAAYFGFSLGGVTVSPASLVTGAVLFGFALFATRAFQGWLEDRFLPTTAVDAGLQNSIGTIVGYIGFIIALALALAQIGLSVDKIAIVAGALSVGIGFGLQSIVNNFVSGLIILGERAIRVGDLVVVGADQGFVRRINVRSTEIETFDRSTMIVPNSTLVSGSVKNLMRSDRTGRIKVAITVQNGSDPEHVRDTLIGLARENDGVSRLPAPSVLFTGIATGGLSFELVCCVDDVETANRLKSDLHFAMFRRFREEKIAIAAPDPGPTLVALAPQTQEAIITSLQKAAE